MYRATLLVRHNPGIELAIENLSISGAQLSGAVTLQTAERVQIMFDLDGTPIDLLGEVVSVEHDALIDRVVVRFISPTSAQVESLRMLVRRMLDHLDIS